MTNLLPLIPRAPNHRPVNTVGKAGFEGQLDPSEFPASRVPLWPFRGHICTLVTLGLESVAKTAPEISFIHDDPGAVKTSLLDRMEGLVGVLMRVYISVVGYWICVPIEECGQRQLYLATSARYPPASVGSDGSSGVPLGHGVEVAEGTTGEIGSGVYSVQWDGTSASPAVQKLLAGYRDDGMVENIARHTESEFDRVTQ